MWTWHAWPFGTFILLFFLILMMYALLLRSLVPLSALHNSFLPSRGGITTSIASALLALFASPESSRAGSPLAMDSMSAAHKAAPTEVVTVLQSSDQAVEVGSFVLTGEKDRRNRHEVQYYRHNSKTAHVGQSTRLRCHGALSRSIGSPPLLDGVLPFVLIIALQLKIPSVVAGTSLET